MQLSHVQYPHQSRQNGSTREEGGVCIRRQHAAQEENVGSRMHATNSNTLRWDENSWQGHSIWRDVDLDLK